MGILKDFIAVFRQIGVSISHLSDAINEHKTATENATEAHQLQEYPSPEISAKLNLPVAIENAITKKCNEGQGWQKANVFVSGATALFTLFAFGAAAYYACIASGQLEQMIKSNSTNREALVSVQRAFVFVKDFDATRKSEMNGQLTGGMRFAFHWENGGDTPTRSMTSLISYKWYPKAPRPDFWHAEYGSPQRLFVGPKSLTRSTPIEVSHQDIQRVHERKGHLYFWGWGKYWDTFKDTPEHISRFCYELTEINGDPMNQNSSINIQTASCEFGNCADDECKNQ